MEQLAKQKQARELADKDRRQKAAFVREQAINMRSLRKGAPQIRKQVSTFGTQPRFESDGASLYVGHAIGPPPAECRNTVKQNQSNAVYDYHGHIIPGGGENTSKSAAIETVIDKLRLSAQTQTLQGLDLRQPFERFDVDGSGSLDEEELRAAILEIGCRLTEFEWKLLWNHFDSDQR